MVIRSGSNHPNWKGGKYINPHGYTMVYSPDHPHCDKNSYVREHRLVMERYIGRYLQPYDDVHHINGNKQDNRIENLQLLTHGEHTRLEMTIDMTGRRCLLCESNTYLRVDRHGRPNWYHVDGRLACKQCYDKRRYYENKKR